MLDAKLDSPVILKKILDAIKELVSDGNFKCTDEGIALQAMDNSHVALVAVELKEAAFLQFRCDRPMPLGVNLASLTKVIKCAKDDDTVTLRASDDQDMLHLIYEAKNTDRIAEYDMKLMDIDADELGIPETEYDATITMSSGEFSRIVRDLGTLGESVKIEVNKEGVRFIAEGESANGSVLLKQAGGGRIERVGAGSSEKKKTKVKQEEDIQVDDDSEEEEEAPKKKKGKSKVKKEKKDSDDEDEDANMSEDDGGSPKDDGEEEKEDDDDDDEEEEDEDGESGKKRKRSSKANGAAKKKSKKDGAAKKGKGKKKDESDDEFEEGGAVIHMNQHVTLTFSLKYLINFSKSQSLSKKVELLLSNEVPLLVRYSFGASGSIAYYLAPKIGDE